MARLSTTFFLEDGPERTIEGNRASSGGITSAKELRYSPPQGPTSQMHQGPGLHGSNFGMCGTQNCSPSPRSSGSPGNHGANKGMGTNRKG